MPKGDKLSDKQQRFVEEYLIDLNVTRAAIRAGYSEKSAHTVGHETLKNPKVAQAISEAKAKLAEKAGVSAERVIKELTRLGFSDLRNVLDSNGNLSSPHEWDNDTAAAISSIEVVTNGAKDADGNEKVEYTHKIKAWDKNQALEKLCKHLGLFEADNKKELNVILQNHADKL